MGQGPLIAFPPGVASLSSTGSPGGAALSDPSGVAVDVAGNMYIADLANNRVVKVTAAGVSSVLSLTGLTGGTTRNGCSSTGLCEPSGLAVDGAGNLVIADVDNNRVVKVTAAGVASVLSLTGLTGGITTSGCSSTELCEPSGLAVDGAGNLVIADFDNNRVVEVTAAGVAGVLSLTGLSGGITSSGCSSTGLCRPSSVAVDGAGDIYITDQYNGRVVEVSALGVASVLSLNGLTGGTASYGCSSTGLCGPGGVAVDSAGDVYIADQYNGRVVEVSALGVASVLSTVNLAGTTYGETYYRCPSTGLCVPDAVAVDGAGDVYIADSGNNRMAEVSQAQAVPLSFTPSNDGYNSANSPQDASVQNIGNQPLILSSVTTTTTGQIADSFNLNGSATTCSGSTSLNAGDTCDLGIEFEPLASGPLSGSVNITDNNLYSASPAVTSQQIALSGTGIGYAVSIGLQESATTVAYGTGVSVTATLSGSNGIPSGSVSYSVDGVTLGTAPLTAGATTSSAQFTLPGTIDADTHGVLVSYAGDSNYPIISSAGFSLTVTAESTGTQLTAPPAATAGSAVQLVATVQPAPVTATTGMVTFASTNASGTVQLGAAPLEPGGTALLMTSALPVGIDSVTATFSGTQNFAGSTSAPASVLVTAAGTTTTLSAPGSAVAGSSVNLTATVLAGSTPVTRGIVAFASGTIQLGAAQLGAGGTATLATTTLPVGSDNVTASFAGTQNFAGSTSSQSSVLVTAAGTTTTLSAPGSAVAGSSVNLTATVLIGTTPMTRGMVTFASTNTGGTVQLGSAQVGAGGTATLATTTLPVGSDSVTASFMGTQNVAGSTSSSSIVNVSAVIVPSYTITANPGTLSIAQGKTGTTTLTFTPAGAYAGSLTLSCGNLPSYVTCAFTQNGTANSTVTMSGNGQAVAVTLSFTTNVATARLNAIPGPQPRLPQSPSAPIETAIAFWLPGGVAGMAAMRRKRRSAGNARRWLPLCLIGFIAVVLAAGFSGCGGSSSVTPMGSSSITITATPSAAGSGSQASQTLSLTVTITS